jgi:predicted lipoprotein with Yx(FWY)xxD motif
LRAPAIAQRSAQLTVLDRADGVSQWAYLGRPLFRFEDDTKPLDVYGIGVDPNFEVALVRRHFRPADVEIRRVVPWGDILTTTQGATLYQRDRVSTTNREDHGSPALGRSLGTATCVDSCTQTWHPLVAPADALASGHWDIALRSEGTRQWVYKGFALYTYSSDAPGAALGNALYELAPVQSTPSVPSTEAPTGGSQDDGLPVHGIPQRVGGGISAFFWHAVVP